MMSPKSLISGVAAAMVVAGGLAFAQEPTTTQPQDPMAPAATPSTTSPSTTPSDSQSQTPSSSSSATPDSPSSTTSPEAPLERNAQADRN